MNHTAFRSRIWLKALLMLSLTTIPWAQQPLTLEKIMQHPRWIGNWPEEARFSPDGQTVYCLVHADPRGYEVVEYDNQGDIVEIHDTASLPESGDFLEGKAVFTFRGDLFVSDPSPTRLTRTQRQESNARWLDSNRVVYRSGDSYYVRDFTTHVDREVVDLRFEEPPKVGEDFRSRQQDRLFPVLKEREDMSKRRQQATGIPRFYLGKDRELVRLEVHPTEDRVLLVHAVTVDPKKDQMPVYLNRDGQVSSERLRPKVGAESPADHRLTLLDLRNQNSIDLSLERLPGFVAGKTTVTVGEARWSRSGRLALSLFSTDHEERWLVEVDFLNQRLVLVDHLHDAAWHSWDMNEFGWTPKQETLWYQSEKTGYAHLYLWNGSQSRPLTQGAFEVTSIRPDPQGSSFYFRANRGNAGRYNVYKVNLQGDVTGVTDLKGNLTFDLTPDGRRLLVLHSQSATPPVAYLQEVGKPWSPTRLSRPANSEFTQVNWTQPQFVEVPSTHHQRTIRSKLYVPPQGVQPNGAGVVFVHGAGYLQNSDEGWSYYFREFMFHTLLTQRGYTVLDMDYRASAGFGRDWRTAIYRQMGTPELEDLKDGVRYLTQKHGVDSQRVGVYGGSYGGFLTLMALFKEPQLFACGAALRPVTDWAQYEHDYTSRILNTPDQDPESYLKSSPIEFAEGLQKPLLLCHGMLDDNVVAQDTVRLTQRLIQLQKDNWETALYPVEPHGFIEPESWLDEYRRILKLFDRNLLNSSKS